MVRHAGFKMVDELSMTRIGLAVSSRHSGMGILNSTSVVTRVIRQQAELSTHTLRYHQSHIDG
jgi:hypothetical protein